MKRGKAQVLVLADGRSKDQHVDAPYGEMFDGVPLIVRTVRQFVSRGHQVIIITRRDDVKQLTRAQRDIAYWEPTQDYERLHGVAMIPKALDRAWGQDNTLIVFGDVYFTEDAVDILSEPTQDWHVYGRSTNNIWTGTQWAEWFAFSTHAGVKRQMREAAQIVFDKWKNSEWHRVTPWEWYYQMEGMDWTAIRNPTDVPVGPHWVEINDMTDDIDFPEDAERLRRVISKR